MLGMTPTLPSAPEGYFDQVRRGLSGDVVFANLEGTLTDVSESPKCGADSSDCYAFRAPPEFARALRAAGFTVVSNANNHSYDYGQTGQEETLEALDRAGIAHTGMPEEIEIVRAGGRRIAFVGFASYANTAPLTDLDVARELIRRATRRAEIVIGAFTRAQRAAMLCMSPENRRSTLARTAAIRKSSRTWRSRRAPT